MMLIARGMCIHAQFRVSGSRRGEMADGKRERPRRRCHPAGTTAAEPVGALGCGPDGRKVRRAPHRRAPRRRDRVTAPELDPLPDGVLDLLRQVSTSTVATQLYKRGFRQPQLLGVRPLCQVADGFVAEAFTMRFIPAREDVNAPDPYRSGNTLQWEAIEASRRATRSWSTPTATRRAASGGDMLMTRAWKRGAAAVVTDGGLRDGHVLSQLPFPTYARGDDHDPGGLAPRGRPAGADRLRRRGGVPGGRPDRRPGRGARGAAGRRGRDRRAAWSRSRSRRSSARRSTPASRCGATTRRVRSRTPSTGVAAESTASRRRWTCTARGRTVSTRRSAA